uniref:Uncharacterized protein n=1 Tax=Timema poppense TaxID=170557 RepID=A0A7R9H3P4_TIMPO|nr:unnamed protein product [Timema poppensis]
MSLSERFQPSKLRDYFVTLTNLLSVKMPGRVTMCYVLLVWRVVPAWTEDVYVKKIESSIPRYQQLQQEQNLTWAELEHIVRHVVEYWTHEPNRTLCIDKVASARAENLFMVVERLKNKSVNSSMPEDPPAQR